MDISHKRNTKQKILDEALSLFSAKGYDSVSLEEIALAVGIKAPSLYKHFKSKKDIFWACLNSLRDHFDENHLLSGDDEETSCPTLESVTEEVVQQMDFVLTDPMSISFANLCAKEINRVEEISEMVETLYYKDAFFYFRKIVQNLIDKKVLRDEDSRIMTIQFASPITSYIALCRLNPGYLKTAKEDVKLHIERFFKLYAA